MAIIPKIRVTQVDNVPPKTPGMAGRVAIVAEFTKTLTNPETATNFIEAVEKATNQPITESSPSGDKCLEPLFNGGAHEVILVGVNPETTGEPTQAEIVAAATSLDENYDILFTPYLLDDNSIGAVKSYIDDRFQASHPVGLIAPVSRENVEDYIATSEIFNTGGAYGLICQSFTVNNKEYDIGQSAAYYTGLVANRKVDASLTMKTLPGVEGVNEEMSFTQTNDKGYKLVEAGYPVLKCINRTNKVFVVVNSRLPHTITTTDGTQYNIDLYMERTINYIIKECNLEEFLGEKNNNATLDGIEQKIISIRNECVKDLGLVEDIKYNIRKVDRDTVLVSIDEIVMDGVVTEIDANVTYDII